MALKLQDIKNIVLVGAGHGIGFAILNQLLHDCPQARIWSTYENSERATPLLSAARQHPNLQEVQMDPKDETQIEDFVNKLKNQLEKQPIDLFINTCGFLHSCEIKPEKSLKDITKSHLLSYFEVNTIITPLWAKWIKSMLSTKSPSVFAVLSAKVGSITDNHLGGWYGYRASKAALNMMVKNIAIEFKQSQLQTCVLSIHPGTTKTELSKPYLSHIKHEVFEAEKSAALIIDIIRKSSLADSGSFMNWDNARLPY